MANVCLHKSTEAQFYPFTEENKDFLEKLRVDLVGGPSIIFTRKRVFDENIIQKSTNLCKPFVGIDASQLYSYSICQPMPTGLYTRWYLDSETKRFTPRQNKTRNFENTVLSFFWRTRPECKIERGQYNKQTEESCRDVSFDGLYTYCNTVFETMRCFY